MLSTTVVAIGISIALVITVIYLITQLRKRDSRIQRLQQEINELKYGSLLPETVSDIESEDDTDDDTVIEQDEDEVFAPIQPAEEESAPVNEPQAETVPSGESS